MQLLQQLQLYSKENLHAFHVRQSSRLVRLWPFLLVDFVPVLVASGVSDVAVTVTVTVTTEVGAAQLLDASGVFELMMEVEMGRMLKSALDFVDDRMLLMLLAPEVGFEIG